MHDLFKTKIRFLITWNKGIVIDAKEWNSWYANARQVEHNWKFFSSTKSWNNAEKKHSDYDRKQWMPKLNKDFTWRTMVLDIAQLIQYYTYNVLTSRLQHSIWWCWWSSFEFRKAVFSQCNRVFEDGLIRVHMEGCGPALGVSFSKI